MLQTDAKSQNNSKRIHKKEKGKKHKPPNSKAPKKLITKGLSLCNGTETPVINLLSIELDAIIRKVESFLNNRGQLSNPPPLLT